MDSNRILKKLYFKGQNPILIFNPPAEYQPVIREISSDIHTEPTGKYTFIQVFVKNHHEANHYLPLAARSLDGDGYFGVCYPKKISKKYTADINRDRGWESLAALNFEGVTQIAIDEDWSALRFRSVKYIRKMTRKFALSEKGKEKIRRGK